jgi:MFS family permease
MLDLSPLRSAVFRHLAAAYWVNELGNWIGEIALTILVYDRTHSPLGTAALFLAMRFVPALLAPFVTVRAETAHPRLLLTLMYLLEAAFFGGIAFLTHHFVFSVLFVLCALDGVLAIAAKALTRSATANHLLEQGLLREGNGILNLGVMASLACAPVIAGGLVAANGAQTALFVDAGTFVLTAVIVALAPGLHMESDQTSGFIGRARNGLSAVRDRRSVRRLIFAVALTMLLGAVPIPIEVVFAKHTLHAGDNGYGFLLGSWGVGMVIGGTAFAVVREWRLTTVFVVGTLLTAIGYGVLAGAPTLAVACAGSAVGGLGNGASWIAAVTAIQERIPLNTQSAVMAVLEGLNQVVPALGFIAGGVITLLSSARIAYAIAALGVAAVVLAFSARPIDQVFVRPLSSGGNSEPPPQEMQDIDAMTRSHVLHSTFTTG